MTQDAEMSLGARVLQTVQKNTNFYFISIYSYFILLFTNCEDILSPNQEVITLWKIYMNKQLTHISTSVSPPKLIKQGT